MSSENYDTKLLMSRFKQSTNNHALTVGNIDFNRDSQTSTNMIEKLFESKKNIDNIVQLIIRKNGFDTNGSFAKKDIEKQVKIYVDSWINLGKFDSMTNYYSAESAINAYNHEFANVYASKFSFTKDDPKIVKSVVNPNGMYAQQDRVIIEKIKPIPFYEKALYKRNIEWSAELPMDEVELPFYRMDKNKNISDKERSKTDRKKYTNEQSFLEQENKVYRGYSKQW